MAGFSLRRGDQPSGQIHPHARKLTGEPDMLVEIVFVFGGEIGAFEIKARKHQEHRPSPFSYSGRGSIRTHSRRRADCSTASITIICATPSRKSAEVTGP